MKKITGIIIVSVWLLSCASKNDTGKFSINGEIKNLPDQNVYLEQIYFGDRDPEVLDTAMLTKGKFTLSATTAQEGMFRVVFEKNKVLFLVINDKKELTVTADADKLASQRVWVNTAANASLYNFITETNSRGEELQKLAAQLKAAGSNADSTLAANDPGKLYNEKEAAFTNYVYAYADTCGSAVLALFALGYVSNPPSDRLQKAVTALAKRFPASNDVAAIVSLVNRQRERAGQPQPQQVKIPGAGDIAPDITMPDVEGKPFSLSSLKGKYVLVDFWASWCGPCRSENPNVVAAYNKYSNKNFTILGVSLDKKKEAWLEAIKQDGLVWKQVSDLKHWDSEAQKIYQFQGIPYNVLINPDGKIIATELRGEDLDKTLAEVLK